MHSSCKCIGFLLVLFASSPILPLQAEVGGEQAGEVKTNKKRYQANWASLDQRPIPGWFEDAKFGIFIHWGPYSVPAWSPRGTYAEWYQYWLQEEKLFGNGDFSGDEIAQYHRQTFGEEFSYYQFADQFTADGRSGPGWPPMAKRSTLRASGSGSASGRQPVNAVIAPMAIISAATISLN